MSAIFRMEIREIEEIFLTSPIAKINWTSQMTILDSSLPLGLSYWYTKQSIEMGWSSNVLKIQIDSDLYSRQISNNKVNNFTTTLPAPQSDLANYLLKDPYIFDLAGAKEKADERDIEVRKLHIFAIGWRKLCPDILEFRRSVMLILYLKT